MKCSMKFHNWYTGILEIGIMYNGFMSVVFSVVHVYCVTIQSDAPITDLGLV